MEKRLKMPFWWGMTSHNEAECPAICVFNGKSIIYYRFANIPFNCSIPIYVFQMKNLYNSGTIKGDLKKWVLHKEAYSWFLIL